MVLTIDIDPYTILGLKLGESVEHVKKAYKELARKVHPDKAKPEDKESAELMFHNIKKAYDFLMNEEAKEKYDREGAAKLIRYQALEKKKAESSATRRRFVDELEKTEAEVVTKKPKSTGPKAYHEMSKQELNAFRAMNKASQDQFYADMKRFKKEEDHNRKSDEKHSKQSKNTTGDFSDLKAAEDDILGDLL